jgi:hypothetical protein
MNIVVNTALEIAKKLQDNVKIVKGSEKSIALTANK